MMIKKSLILLAALTLTFTGCSNEEAVEPSSYVAEGTPIKVNATVEELTGELTTKAAGYDGTNMPKEFCLQIKHPTSDKFSYYAWMKYDDTSSKWVAYADDAHKTELTMYWAGDNQSVTVTAATFDFKGKTTFDGFTPETDQSTDDNFTKSDYLFMQPTSFDPTETNNTVEVTLSHLMAKLVVNFNFGSAVTTNPISTVTISGIDQSWGFTIGQNDGAMTWAAGSTTDAKDFTPRFVSFAEGVATYEALVKPQTIASGDLEVKFTNTESKSYIWTSSADITLVGGKPNVQTLNMPTASGNE